MMRCESNPTGAKAMPTLDVSWVTQEPEFADMFQVLRRPETISQTGRSVTSQVTATAYGTIVPTGDNSLVRQTDYELGRKTLTIYTTYRLQQAAPGYQPDLVLYRGNQYVVSSVEDFSAFGEGFIVAEVSSIIAIDTPPQ
jgi:galactose-6-phosphate isomerase